MKHHETIAFAVTVLEIKPQVLSRCVTSGVGEFRRNAKVGRARSGSGWKWWFHGCWMWITRPNIWRLGSHGHTPIYHPCFFLIVFEIHHPAIGVPPWLWKRTDSGAGRDHRLGRCHGGARTASAAEVLYSIGSEWGWGMEGLSLFLKGEDMMVWNRTILMKSKIHAVYKIISALTSCVWRYIIWHICHIWLYSCRNV